jgi:hypothetical protein
MNKHLRLIGLTAHSLITIGLLVVIFRSGLLVLVASASIVESRGVPLDGILSLILIPAFFHAIFTLVGAIPLYLRKESRNEVEKKILLLLMFFLSLGNVKTLAIHTFLTHSLVLQNSNLSMIMVFSSVFTTYLLLITGLFQQGVNTNKFQQFIMIGASLCLIISLAVPLSVNTNSFMTGPSISNTTLVWTLRLINILSCFNFAMIYLQERTQHNFIRCGGFILLILGQMCIDAKPRPIIVLLGMIFYIAGILLVSPLGKTYHL